MAYIKNKYTVSLAVIYDSRYFVCIRKTNVVLLKSIDLRQGMRWLCIQLLQRKD